MIIIYVKLINLSCKYHFLYIHNRCPNGDCVHQITECNLQKSVCSLGLSSFLLFYSLEHPIRCWNNECVNSEDECPFSNGCSSNTPYRCYSGECVAVMIHSFSLIHRKLRIVLLFVVQKKHHIVVLMGIVLKMRIIA